MEEWQSSRLLAGSRGCFVPKEHHSENLNQFRTISLHCVQGEISFSILAIRLTTYMTDNTYIDSSVQKGGKPGFSGCVEHTSGLTQLLHEARINHKNLTVVWLDMANAYGFIPHQLIQEALKHYHVPEQAASSLIRSYYSNIHLRFSCKNYATSWISMEKGIVTGCFISVPLYVMGMNLVLKAAEVRRQTQESVHQQIRDSWMSLPSQRNPIYKQDGF